MSTLYTDNIRANNASQITVPTGQKIVGTDTGSIVAPGSIIQVQSGVKRDTMLHSGASFTDIGLSVTITPKQSNSHIMILASIAITSDQTSASTLRLLRDSTVILPDNPTSPGNRSTGMYDNYVGANGYVLGSNSFNFVDETRTAGTSAIIYKFQVKSHGSGETYINRSSDDSDATNYVRSTSHIQVMEIAQ